MNRWMPAAATAALMLGLVSAPLAAEPLTDAERQRLLDHLERTRELFLASVEGLTPEQWSFKAAEDRWSIAECAEHITVSEDFIRDAVAGILQTTASPEQRAATPAKEEQVITLVVDRSQKFQAPEPVQPTGRWIDPDATLAHFAEARAQTVALATDGGDLRGSIQEHPAFGDLDAYGWLFFLSSHTERHTLQIEEVKTAPGYPGG